MMDASNFFSTTSNSTTAKRRRTNKSAAGRLISSSTTERSVSEVVSDVGSWGERARTYSPGQGLLDFDISDGEDGDEEEVGDEGYDAESFTSFNTPNSGVQSSLLSTSTPLSRRQRQCSNASPSSGNMSQLLSLLQQQQATLIQHGEVLQETLRNQHAQSTKQNLPLSFQQHSNKFLRVYVVLFM